MTWVYGSGNSITLPRQQYLIVNQYGIQEYYEYGEKNSFRMQPYHRLDFGLNYKKLKDWGEKTWTLSIYNVYNRRNPFFIYFQDSANNNIEFIKVKQVSLFPIIPTLRYAFKF